MKFFHESPNSYFRHVQNYTDGDYALVHLFEENAEYRNNFRSAVTQGREVILDNSIFELGEAYDQEDYAKWIDWLRPAWYIIPDVLEDYKQTSKNVLDWVSNPTYNGLSGKTIGVLQGKSEDEIRKCYDIISPHVDMVAISFDYSFYEEGPGFSQLDMWMRGRQRLLRWVDTWINPAQKVHLLGCALPQEGLNYSRWYPWIYSIDTSNPVMSGLEQEKYIGRAHV